MAVVLIIAILAMSSIPLLQGQLAVREIETIARRFISHAQFTRQQALYLGQSVQMTPQEGNDGIGAGQLPVPVISQRLVSIG